MSEATGQKPTNIPENPMGKYVKHPERYKFVDGEWWYYYPCLLYTSPSPRDGLLSRMPSSA